MAKIKTIIVEDEEISRFFLKEELSRYADLEVIDEYENGLEGLRGINESKPDLVFVDIEMPMMNGFQMLQRLKCAPAIIFCTGYGSHALRAWDYNASDFITKPIESLRLKKALEKALSDIYGKNQSQRLNAQREMAGLENIEWKRGSETISRFFSSDEIIYIQADGDYSKFFLISAILEELENQGPYILLYQRMKKVVEIWEKHGFKRAHRGYAVNTAKIVKWNKTKMLLSLKEAVDPIPVGRTYMKNFSDMDSFIK